MSRLKSASASLQSTGAISDHFTSRTLLDENKTVLTSDSVEGAKTQCPLNSLSVFKNSGTCPCIQS